MNKYLFHWTITEYELYNCSNMTLEQQLLNPQYPRPTWGYLSVIVGTITLLLNFVCIKAMMNERNWKFSCYKLMAYLTFFDSGSIICGTIIYGFIFITGVTFCDYPNTIYLTGSHALLSYLISSTICLILVILRIVGLTNYTFLKKIFYTSKIYYLIGFGIAYGAAGYIFCPPPIASSYHGAGQNDPLIYPNRRDDYVNYAMIINCVTVVCMTTFLYMIFARRLQNEFKKNSATYSPTRQFQSRAMFLQISILSVCYFCTSFFYVLIQIIKLPRPFFVVAQLFYQLVTAIPCFLYLFLNKNIRADVMSMTVNGIHKVFILQFLIYFISFAVIVLVYIFFFNESEKQGSR